MASHSFEPRLACVVKQRGRLRTIPHGRQGNNIRPEYAPNLVKVSAARSIHGKE